MGTRKKKPLADEHITTKIVINKANNCNGCPLRLYAKQDSTIKLGIGNIYSNTMMILPNYNIEAKIGYITILKLLQDIYKEIAGRELLEEYYITRFIKCYDVSQFDIITHSWYKCSRYLAYEICRLKPKKIILFDNTYDDFIRCYVYNKGIIVNNVMNPAVLYYNNEQLKNKFLEQLKEVL